MTTYIPTLDSLYALARKRRIQHEYDGTNMVALARKYKLTVRRIQTFLEEPMSCTKH